MRLRPSLILLTLALSIWITQRANTQAPRAFEVARGLAQRHLDELVARHGGDRGTGRRDLRGMLDADGRSHHAVRQLHRGVPVWGGEAIVHLDAAGDLEAVTDDFIDDLSPIDVTPVVTAAEAIDFATFASGLTREMLTAEPQADLWVMRGGDADRLVYRVQLRREDGSPETSMPVAFIDAHDGSLVDAYDNLQTGTAPVTGTSNYYGSLSLTGFLNGASYYLEDVGRKLGTFTYNNGTSSLFRTTDADGSYIASNQKAMVDAHYVASKTYDYYKNVHGRNGIDGVNGPGYLTSIDGVTQLMSSLVHYSTNYNNAFWNGQAITYGDGDGTTFTALTTLDIGGHEMTHGVTERTAGLVYSGESGALNESFSDVFGAMVERYASGESANTWKIGEQAFTPSNGTGDALRYMDNPHLASNSGFTSDDDPDHYSERYTGSSDNGGVHINSGIANKAFYLVAMGGTHHLGGSMTGIGADAAGAIWYKALTTYMTSSTNFAGARTATLNAAAAIYGTGSTNYNAVCDAWAMVGVGSSCGAPPPPPPPPTGNLLSNGGFEGSISPWVASGTGAFYVANGNFPHGGTGYIYFGTTNNATGQIYQQVSIPSTATGTLTFWLNVTSDETTTTTQYDKLFVEVRNTAGTLLSTLGTFSNLSKGTAGVYSQKSFSVSAFKGQTVRIQFRATTDSSLQTTFRIDDACLDGCGSGSGSATTTAVAAAPASPAYGTAVTFTATVTGSGSCDPAGTVTFVDGATTIGSASLNASNQAAVTTSSLSAGPHTITASFAPSSSACLSSNGSVSTTIAKASQSINFGALGDKKYGDAPFAVSATATSGLPVSFSIFSGPATINGSTVTITGTGLVTVRASQGGDTNYNAATNVDQSFNVGKASQTITFFAPANKTYGDAPFPVSGNASSGLVVAFSIASGPATIAGNTVTLTGAGTVVVRASQSGNNNYSPAPDVDRSIAVAQKSQTITFFAPANKTYGDAPFPVSGNASSGLVVAFSIASGPATVAGNTVTLTGAGTVVVRASQAGNKDYSAAPDVDRSITVAKKSQTINFAALTDRTFGDPPIALTASASSSLPVKFGVVSGPATIGVGNVLNLTGAGPVVIRASQGGNADYEPAPDVDRSFNVAKASQSIAFFAPPNKTYGDAPFPVSANASSGLVVAFSIASGPASISGNTVKLTGAGTVVVRASQGGNKNYDAAPDVDRSINVAKGTQTITFAQPPNKTVNDDPFPLAASASSGLPVTFSVLSGRATVFGNIVTLGGETGTVTVRASQAGDGNYDPAADVDRTFEVVNAGQTITFAPLGNKTFGDPPFTVSATADSGLPVQFTIVSGPATIADDLVTITGAGVVIVRASQPGDATYSAAADVDQSFNVAQADQSIVFGALSAKTFGDAPFAVNATATSNLPVTFSIVSGPATINGNTLSITGAGLVVVRASQGGDGNYHAAADVDQPLAVGKADQAITFNPLPNKTFGDGPFAVNATASSGLAVTLSILSGHASIGADHVITITGAGPVVVRASQAGDDNYNAAADVDQSFMVNQPTQSIAFDSIDDVTYGAAPIVLAATASSGLPVTFSIVSGPAQVAGNVLSITGAGAVTVRASQPGNDNYAPADSVDQSFTVAQAELIVTANSASRSYWDPDPPVGVSINGLVNGDAISALISTGTNDQTPAGVYQLQVTLSDPGNRLPNYAVSTLLGTFTIQNPAPAIASFDPTSFAIGNGDRQLIINGQDFVPQSMVFWSGSLLQTTFVSRTELNVIVPAINVASPTVSYITIANGGPGGGVAGPEEFFVTNTGAPVDDADTGTADEGGSADASVGGTGPGTPDSVSVSAIGEGSVTVAQFDGNPGPPATFQNSDRFFDVFVPSASTFTSLTIVSCDMNGGNVVLWSDGVTWMPVSNQTYNPATGCVTIVIDDTTSPSLSQLTGTYFIAAADTTAPATAASASVSGGAYVFGTWANDSVTVNLHATDNAGGVGVASLTSSATGATTIPETTAPGANRAFTITADGETTIAFFATDDAGNVESVQTRIVRINRQAPTGTAQASPTALWPPNNKLVPVTISGQFTGGVGVASATFAVADEYGEVSLSGAVSIAADGTYRFTVKLPASRRGDDLDGRAFSVRVDGLDAAGNRGTAETIVLVPHSQGK